MVTRSHASKRAAQSFKNTPTITPKEVVQDKTIKGTSEHNEEESRNSPAEIENIENMFKIIMTKLKKLDTIDERMNVMRQELIDVKKSLDYAYEMSDLKKENIELRKSEKVMTQRLHSLEERNSTLNNRVIDLQASLCVTTYYSTTSMKTKAKISAKPFSTSLNKTWE